MALANGLYRSPDPFLTVEGGYILRRVAPDARKINLDDLGGKLNAKLLSAMAFDLGAIHAGSVRPQDLKADLAGRPANWLQQAIGVMIKATTADYESWKAARLRDEPNGTAKPSTGCNNGLGVVKPALGQ